MLPKPKSTLAVRNASAVLFHYLQTVDPKQLGMLGTGPATADRNRGYVTCYHYHYASTFGFHLGEVPCELSLHFQSEQEFVGAPIPTEAHVQTDAPLVKQVTQLSLETEILRQAYQKCVTWASKLEDNDTIIAQATKEMTEEFPYTSTAPVIAIEL